MCIALATGILLDHLLNPAVVVWLGLTIAGWILFFVGGMRSRDVRMTMAVFLCCLSVGALRHHSTWTLLDPRDISRIATDEPTPVRLNGLIATPPTVSPASREPETPLWMQVDRTTCELNCEHLQRIARSIPVSGRIQLSVSGHLLQVKPGDRVEVVGQLVRVAPPGNPGMFDYQSYLRSQGIRCFIRVDHPDAISVVRPGVNSLLARKRAEWRDSIERALTSSLSPETVPVAVSLLLGNRSLMPDRLTEEFIASGTMHLLAISGLHVGILAGLVLLACRFLRVSGLGTSILVVVIVLFYAFITDHRPSVLRASILIVLAAVAWPRFTVVNSTNLLACCAIVILLCRPTDLFDVGAQLSFLAVMAIAWSARLLAEARRDPLRQGVFNWIAGHDDGRTLGWLSWFAQGYFVTVMIWLFTLPLIIASYHIFAPVGILLNVLLIPVLAICLAAGYLALLSSALLPVAFPLLASLFGMLLGLLLWPIRLSATCSVGHMSAASPPQWWLVGFYAILGILISLCDAPSRRRWVTRCLCLWIVAGLTIPLVPRHHSSLRCTFLALGHGCCVVVETPEGRALLYDAGAFSGAEHGGRVVQSVLSHLGIEQLDGVVISHADVDHFNIVPQLFESMPVGGLLLNRHFLDFSQPDAERLCLAAVSHNIPIELVQAGDRLELSPGIETRILHPPDSWPDDVDNSASTVLLIEYAGRRILLTGDLEGDGLLHLLSHAPLDVDVLLSPHHGSAKANPGPLGDWATPEYVVVSGTNTQAVDELASAYPTAQRVLSTALSGAITVEIDSTGVLSVNEFRSVPAATDAGRLPTGRTTQMSGGASTAMYGRWRYSSLKSRP